MVDYIIGGAILAVIAISIVIGIVKVIKNNKLSPDVKSRQADEVVEKHGVRYTPETTIVDKDGKENVTYLQGDIVIKPRKKMLVGKGGEIKPGKWTILASNETTTSFNVRIGNYVQEYKHGQKIILSEGDEICPTSTTIILR